MAKFMLILHDSPGRMKRMSPEEMQRTFEKYRAWSDRIRAAGRMVASDKLQDEGGKVLSRREGRLSVLDGPYSEAKEVVAGFFVFKADNYEQAVELTSDCPHLNFGRIELRQDDAMGCGEE